MNELAARNGTRRRLANGCVSPLLVQARRSNGPGTCTAWCQDMRVRRCALPDSIPTVDVASRFLALDGRPLSGSVTFRAPAQLTFPAADVIPLGPGTGIAWCQDFGGVNTAHPDEAAKGRSEPRNGIRTVTLADFPFQPMVTPAVAFASAGRYSSLPLNLAVYPWARPLTHV
ncbi:hypothetical protein GCM10010341_83900 [Streptomyces noursei]|nr:hypothetical protein GCM10010341_83900 [Streptomyces noursei]